MFSDKFVEIERWVFGAVFLRPTSCHASFLPYCCFYDIFKVKTAGLGVVKTLKSSPYAVKNIDKDEEECYEHSHPASLIQMHQVWNIWNIFRGCHWKSLKKLFALWTELCFWRALFLFRSTGELKASLWSAFQFETSFEQIDMEHYMEQQIDGLLPNKLVLALLLLCCVWFLSAFRIDLPGTTSGLTMKLTQLTMTNMQLGK